MKKLAVVLIMLFFACLDAQASPGYEVPAYWGILTRTAPTTTSAVPMTKTLSKPIPKNSSQAAPKQEIKTKHLAMPITQAQAPTEPKKEAPFKLYASSFDREEKASIAKRPLSQYQKPSPAKFVFSIDTIGKVRSTQVTVPSWKYAVDRSEGTVSKMDLPMQQLSTYREDGPRFTITFKKNLKD